MSETLDYIDQYFCGTLSPSEKEAFENRIESDPLFAQETAFYISTRDALKRELYQQKKQEFQQQYLELSSRSAVPEKSLLRTLRPYITAAAACLLIFVGYQLFFKTTSASQLANDYIKTELVNPHESMGSSADSFARGKAAYNNKQYEAAEQLLAPLANRNNSDAEAIRYLGMAYLVTQRYDKAIEQFDKLSGMTLQANQGPFYKAVTLMKRSGAGDKEKAKALLEEVIQKGLPGKKEAAVWIEKL